MGMTVGDQHFLKSHGRGVWVPAFAGTTWCYPLAAATLENRRRMRIMSSSQTSR